MAHRDLHERRCDRFISAVVRKGWWAVSVLLAGTLAFSAQQNGTQSLPQEVLSELNAADASRGQLVQEEQQWRSEKQRLGLLLQSVRRETERLETAAGDAGKKADELSKRIAKIEEEHARARAVEDVVESVSKDLEAALKKLASQSPPGLVPEPSEERAADPSARLSAASRRLDRAERRLSAASMELVTGDLNGTSVTVKLLRGGGVGAWWVSLDGTRAGTAVAGQNGLILEPSKSGDEIAAISRAVAVAEGRAAPEWVLLPARHIRKQ